MKTEILDALRAERIDFDSAFVGFGSRLPNGAVRIHEDAKEGLENLPESFISNYPGGKDIIGQIFAAYPSLVQMASIEMLNAPSGELGRGQKERGILARYLGNYDISWLMIVGANFDGNELYWVTLYRNEIPGRAPAEPFSPAEQQIFQYLAPALLLKLYRSRKKDASSRRVVESGVPALTPYDLQLALILIQGRSYKQAAATLNLEVETVRKYVSNIRAALKMPQSAKLTLDILYRGSFDQSEKTAQSNLAS